MTIGDVILASVIVLMWNGYLLRQMRKESRNQKDA